MSEYTAIALYIYNSAITHDKYAQVSQTFAEVSHDEMHHLSLFCRLAFLSGADPRAWSGPPRSLAYWSPSCAAYPRDIVPLLQNAIHSEHQAIDQYRQQTRTLSDPKVCAVLEAVIADEQRHIEMFSALMRNFT